MASHPTAVPSAPLTHKCGRCRLEFVLESTDRSADAHWWLCPSCRLTLLGDPERSASRWK